jgi:hypothetical protein
MRSSERIARAQQGPVPAPGSRRRPRLMPAVAGALLTAIGVIVLVPGLMAPAIALAESPAPSQPGAGDPRSAGQGPGLVGDPLTAIIVVAAIAILAVAVTLLYLRATTPRDATRQD